MPSELCRPHIHLKLQVVTILKPYFSIFYIKIQLHSIPAFNLQSKMLLRPLFFCSFKLPYGANIFEPS